MTIPRDPRAFNEPSPAVVVDPDVRTAAGTPVVVRVMVTNRAPEPRTIAITALGVDAAWLPRPSRSLRPIMPGASTVAELTLSPATGTVPARYPLALAVQALDPVNEQATSATAIAETVLVVDAPGQVEIEIKPTDVTGMFRKRVTVFLRNRGPATESVHLAVHSPEAAELHLSDEIVDVPSGQTVPVPGRIRIERRLFGHRSRYTYTVEARGSGASQRAEGSVTTRALLGANSSKAFVLMAVVVLWAGLALVFIPKLSSSIKNDQNKAANKAAAIENSVVPGPSGSSGSSGSGGSGGSGANGSGSASSGGSGGGAGSSAGAARAASAAGVQLNGTVTGQSPARVNVAIKPTSLVDEAAEGATGVGVNTDSLRTIGKIWGNALPTIAPSSSAQNRSTVTSSDGAWSFGSVKSPGYYLLTFAKPGYQTQRYVVDASSAVATQPLKVDLVAGQGSLSGRIRGPSGALGAAKITITDGINTITTSSNSKGDIGSWSVSGLSTPGSYLVSASKDGLSTESAIVTLGAGGSSTVNLKLKVGVASLVGKVQGPDSLGNVVGLGGVQVTATDGAVSRTASTVTVGSIAGNYTLPDLVPGTYSVTMNAPGFLPQTQQVTIKAGQSKATMNSMLSSATATVTGTVTGDQFNSDGSTATVAGGTTPKVGPVNGAGLILASAANTYKITSGTDGTFRMNGVAPGTYVLSAQYSGLTTSYVTVKAIAGQVVEVSSKAIALDRATTVNTSTITGFVSSAVSPDGSLTCTSSTGGACSVKITFTLRDSDGCEINISGTPNSEASCTDPNPAVPDPNVSTQPASASGPTGYTLVRTPTKNDPSGLAPGLYRLTIGATGFLPATISVRVPENAVAQAPSLGLFPANTISGTVNTIDAPGSLSTNGPSAGVPYTNCVWAVPVGTSIAVPQTCDRTELPSSKCLSTGQPGPGFDTIQADNTYKIDGLCDGAYNVYVVVLNPWYVRPAPTASQTVTHGQTVTYSPHVARKGRVQLKLLALDPSTGLLADAGPVTGTANCGGESFGDLTQVVNSTVTISGVDAGARTCTVTPTSPSTLGPASVGNVSVGNDVDTSSTVILTQTVTNVFGRVISAYGDNGANAVVNTDVSITGVVGYDGSNPKTQTVTVRTDANGCFALTAGGGGPVAGGSDCGTIGASTTAFPLVNRQVTVSVAAGTGTQALGSTNITMVDGLNALRVKPAPIAVTGLSLTATDSVDLSAAQITATAINANGSGTITFRAAANGALSWTDSNIGTAGQAWPGTYALTAKLPGHADASATLTCTFGTATCTMSTFNLAQLGTLSGTLTGSLGPNPGTGYPTQPLVGATVTAVNGGTTLTATADTSGNFQFAGANSAFAMAPGTWHLTVSAFGFTSVSGDVVIASGSNVLNSLAPTLSILYVTPVDFTVRIQTAANKFFSCPAATPDCGVSVTMQRIDTGVTFSASPHTTASPNYVFPQLIPSTYLVTIQGPGLTLTSTVYNVPFATTKSLDVPTALVRNSVSGQVNGPVGQAATLTPLNGVSVELGHMNGANFVVDQDTDGNDMVTTTQDLAGVSGGFSFNNVPNGNYVARYNAVAPVLNGYLDPGLNAFVSVSGGQGSSFPVTTLTRVTHNVNLTVTAKNTGGGVSGATGITLTSVDDPTWIFSPQPVTTAGLASTWVFNAVPFGNWLISITLPSGHFGSLADTGSTLSCSTGSATTPVTCTSKSGSPLVVPGTGSADVNTNYTLDEYQVGLSVLAVRLPTDPNAVPPTSVGLIVKDGANQVYSNPALTVSTSAPTVPTDTFWGAIGASYTATATVDSSVLNWTPVPQTLSQDAPDTPLSLKETGATTVTVTITGMIIPPSATALSRTVTLVAPSGSGIIAPAPFPVIGTGTTATFTNVPFSAGWTATITGSYSIPAGGGTNYTISGTSPEFTIDSLTAGVFLSASADQTP